MLLGTIVVILTALWHALAAWHFAVQPARTLGRTTAERPVSPIAIEILRFLGAINLGFVVLGALAAAWPEARSAAFVTLAVANLSQAVVDLRVQRLGLARGPMFRQILVGDVAFTVANLLAWVASVA